MSHARKSATRGDGIIGTTTLDDENDPSSTHRAAAGYAIVGSGTANPERHHVPEDGF